MNVRRMTMLGVLVLSSLGYAQETTTVPVVPAQSTAAPMTKSDMKAQRKQQKQQEKAAKESAKAQKDSANALKHQDKATDAQEKVNRTPAPAAAPTAAPPPQL